MKDIDLSWVPVAAFAIAVPIAIASCAISKHFRDVSIERIKARVSQDCSCDLCVKGQSDE